ncbi:helix-turn-helix domain-containing protein, partial [Blautia massiliensis (ex Durand et al. 2017)]|uniref:helix-turn-helix domain-containing protein n=1 Tax=Blautia massiliensis (ex Durand et al. 2017) TaxID=1737424 RepID=UPI0022E42D53
PYIYWLRDSERLFLKNGGIQVSEVAAKVGYGDPLAFSKVFKARTGRSPREYKEEKRRLVVKGKKGDYMESES